MRSVLIIAVVTMATAASIDYHETLDDNHDMERVVQDPVLNEEFLNCYIHKGPCNEIIESYRIHLPVAIGEACARCNVDQKHMFRVWLDGMKKYSPKGYMKFVDFYDPERTKMDTLEAALANY